MLKLNSKGIDVKRQRGLSIVELMVALLLGSLVVMGILQIFLTSGDSYRFQQVLAEVNNRGTFAIDVLTEDLRKAGHPGSISITFDAVDTAASEEGDDTGNEPFDQIVIRYEDAYPDAATGQGTDCLGQATPTDLVVNTYYVDTGRLMCLGNGGAAAQEIISGVEGFQVLYGIDRDLTDGIYRAESFVTLPDLVAMEAVNDALPSTEQVGQLGILKSVRVALLVAAEEPLPTLSDWPADATLQVGDHEIASGDWGVDFNDKRLRRVFTASVSIRNSIRSTSF